MKAVNGLIEEVGKDKDPHYQGITKSRANQFAIRLCSLEGDVIRELVKRDSQTKAQDTTVGSVGGPPAIYHIWPDFKLHRSFKQVNMHGQGRRRATLESYYHPKASLGGSPWGLRHR